MQIGHVLGGGQLAVGDVEEVATSGQLAEQLPRALVGAVVGGVAALDAELHRDGAVAGHGQALVKTSLAKVGIVLGWSSYTDPGVRGYPVMISWFSRYLKGADGLVSSGCNRLSIR